MSSCAIKYPSKTTDCDWLSEWVDPNDCNCPHDGYSRNDGCLAYRFTMGSKCEIRIGKSLTEGKNKDHPEEGSRKANPTWETGNLCYWLSKADIPELHISNFELKNGNLVITRNDGTTYEVELPDDLHVTNFELKNGNLVVTRSDGTTYSVPLPDELHITNFELKNGKLVVTRNDGQTYSVPLPDELHITNFELKNDKLIVTRNDGTTYEVDLSDYLKAPSLARSHFFGIISDNKNTPSSYFTQGNQLPLNYGNANSPAGVAGTGKITADGCFEAETAGLYNVEGVLRVANTTSATVTNSSWVKLRHVPAGADLASSNQIFNLQVVNTKFTALNQIQDDPRDKSVFLNVGDKICAVVEQWDSNVQLVSLQVDATLVAPTAFDTSANQTSPQEGGSLP